LQGRHPQHRKEPLAKLLRRALFLFLGASLVSVGLEIFLVPNRIIDGGIVGVSILLSALTPVPLGAYLTLLNLRFFISVTNRSAKRSRRPPCSPFSSCRSAQRCFIPCRRSRSTRF